MHTLSKALRKCWLARLVGSNRSTPATDSGSELKIRQTAKGSIGLLAKTAHPEPGAHAGRRIDGRGATEAEAGGQGVIVGARADTDVGSTGSAERRRLRNLCRRFPVVRRFLVSVRPESLVATDLVTSQLAAHAVLEGALRTLMRPDGPLEPCPDPVEALHVAEDVGGVLRFEVAKVAAHHSVPHVRRLQVVLEGQQGLGPKGTEPALAELEVESLVLVL